MIDIYTGDNPIHPVHADRHQFERRIELLNSSSSLDRVLLGYSSIWPHNHAYAPYVFAKAERASLIVAHRPGVMDPAAAARYFATLDWVSNGRLAINIVIGNAEKDIFREGDYSAREDRYARAVEYVEVMKRAWSEPDKFDHSGTFYREENVRHSLRPINDHVPIFMGGQSDAAVDFGAKHADTYMLWGEPLDGIRDRIDTIRAAATRYGRSPKFSMNVRVFVADTDDQAWALAREAERTIELAQDGNTFMRSGSTDKSAGKQRVLSLTEEVYDDCFWTRLIVLLGAYGTAASLVGSKDRVLKSLAAYKAAGVDAFLLTTGTAGEWTPELNEFAEEVKRHN